MASPQLENGFIQIASGKEENDILTALVKVELSGTEYQIVLWVIRKTWGFKKTEDWISLSQFEKITNKSRARVCEALKALVKKNILVKNTLLGKTTKISINKNFDEWNRLVKKSGLVKKTRLARLVKNTRLTSKEYKTQLVKNTGHTKDTITKETITKKNLQSKDCGNKINSLLNEFKKINPLINFGNKTQRNALEEMLKEFGFEKSLASIQYAISVQGQKYAPTITTPIQLKNKIGDLRVFYEKSTKSRIVHI